MVEWVSINMTIGEITSTKKDYFEDVYGNSWINGSVIIFYLGGFISIFGLMFVSWFERNGLAGPYRTLINQLVVFNIESVSISSLKQYRSGIL